MVEQNQASRLWGKTNFLCFSFVLLFCLHRKVPNSEIEYLSHRHEISALSLEIPGSVPLWDTERSSCLGGFLSLCTITMRRTCLFASVFPLWSPLILDILYESKRVAAIPQLHCGHEKLANWTKDQKPKAWGQSILSCSGWDILWTKCWINMNLMYCRWPTSICLFKSQS